MDIGRFIGILGLRKAQTFPTLVLSQPLFHMEHEFSVSFGKSKLPEA